jgi:hypothetical protein
MIVDAFKANNNKRPYELDYTKMKKLARDEIDGKGANPKSTSKPGKKVSDLEEETEKIQEPVNNEFDLLGMDDPEPAPVQLKKPEPKMDLNDIDLLGGDEFPSNNQNNNQPKQAVDNMDLLGIDLFV